MKLVMCLAIIVICAAIGRQLANKMSTRLAFFREYQTAVTFLFDKVVGLGSDLYQALYACSNENIRPFFHACAEALKKNPQLRLDTIWRESLAGISAQLACLNKKDIRFLLDGGEALEALCANPSERQAVIYTKRLAAQLDALEAEKKKKCRLFNSAGLLGGLMIALLVV